MKISLTHDEMKTVLIEVIRERMKAVGAPNPVITFENCYFDLQVNGESVDTYGHLYFTYDTEMGSTHYEPA